MAHAQDLYKEALEIANKAQLRLKDITSDTDSALRRSAKPLVAAIWSRPPTPTKS